MNQLQTREQDARDLVGLKMSQIQTILGGDKAKASIFASAIVNIANDKDLRGCNVESIVNTAMQIVQIGLHPNKLFGQAYVVPYGGIAQLQIGYKGLISLGYRNGWKFRAIAVYSCDKFEINFAGIKDEINFTPSYDERDETDGKWVFDNLRGVLVFAVDKQGAEFSEFVSKKKLEKLRLKSQNQKSQDKLAHIWLEWAEEMYKAKAIKYVASRLPINDSLAEALSLEDEPIRAEQSKPQTPKTQNLNDLLNSEKPNNPTINQKATVENSPTSAKNAQVEDAEFIEAAPFEVEIDVNADVMPLDALQAELIKRGASEAEAEKLVERLDPSDAEAYLADPNAIDALMEDLRG